MQLAPISLLGAATYAPLADAACAEGYDPLAYESRTLLDFPDGVGSTVLEGTVARGQRACWTVRLKAAQRLDLRLTSAGGGAALEVWSQLRPTVRTKGGTGSPISTASVSSFTGRGETRMSMGPQSLGGDFLIAICAPRNTTASYQLEVGLHH